MTALTYQRPHRPWPVKVVNTVARTGRLDADELVGAARRRTGLEDFGAPAVDEPLHLLVDSFERDARLSALGSLLIRRAIVAELSRRLRIVAALPGVARTRIERPIFVLGLPRTGTTLLFNLLAQVPGARPLLGWEAFDPLPPPRRWRYRTALRGLDYMAPDLHSVHELVPDGPQECLQLLSRTVVSWGFLVLGRLSSYERWLWEADRETHAAAYALHRAQLQLLQSRRKGGRWLLKSPAHLNAIPALLDVYPDACIVQTHRDLGEVLPSSCSLFAVGASVLSDAVDPHQVGRDWVERLRRTIDRAAETRASVPAQRFYDVAYRDLMRDPCAVVRRIHEHFGSELPAGAVERMHAYLQANPAGRTGAHRYSLDQFGLDAAQVAALNRDYQEKATP